MKRIRTQHVVYGILFSIVGLVAFSVYRAQQLPPTPAPAPPPSPPNAPTTDHEEEFLKQIRTAQESVAPPSGVGSLPPITEDPSMVPVIHLEKTEYDLGTVPNTGISEFFIPVRNIGKRDLHINEIKTSCICTQGEIAPNQRIIPPGGEVPMRVTIDPSRIPGFFSRKILTLFSNDPKNPALQVGISAHVEPEFSLEPERLDLGIIEPFDQVIERRILFRQLQEQPIDTITVAVMGAQGANGMPLVEAKVEARPEEVWAQPKKHEFEILVRLHPSIPAGPFRFALEIHPGIQRVPRYIYEIQGSVGKFFTISPDPSTPLILKRESPDQPPTATVIVKADRAVSIAEPVAESPLLRLVPRQGNEPSTAYLDIILDPKNEPVTGLSAAVSYKIRSGLAYFEEKVQVEYHEN
jgi:hypothetical protein